MKTAVHNRRAFTVAVFLALASFAFDFASRSFYDPVLLMVNLGLHTGFVLLVTAILFNHVLHGRKATAERIVSAISVYFLLGLLWAFLYVIVETVNPGSFLLPGAAAEGMTQDRTVFGKIRPLMYFSFTTLTTLGYGDITPRDDFAQSLSTLEALVGQIYIAVLVARLVGLHIAQRVDGATDDRGTRG